MAGSSPGVNIVTLSSYVHPLDCDGAPLLRCPAMIFFLESGHMCVWAMGS